MILHCFSDEYDTYVAETIEEAISLWVKDMGWGAFHEDWSQIPDGEIFAVYDEDEELSESRTAYEWALLNGKGFLCSTEY